MRALILGILSVIMTACASAPVVIALERPEGRSETQASQDTSFCNDVSAGSQAMAVDCMQRRGYRLVRLPSH